MSPLAHFPGGPRNWDWGGPIYLNQFVLCFDNHESKDMLKLKNFLPSYNLKENYITQFKSITFKEEDEFRILLLEKQPKDLSLEQYNKEGKLIRRVLMHGCEFIEMPDCEVEIKLDNFEDLYF